MHTDITKDFKLSFVEKSKKFTPNDTLKFNIVNKKNHPIDSVVYHLDGEKISDIQPLNNKSLGIYDITASIFISGNKLEYKENISIVSASKPKLYTYTILNEYPHKKNAYKGWSFTAIPYMKAQDLGGNPVCARLILKPERSSKKLL